MRRLPGTPTRAAILVAPTVLGLVLGVAGCSGDDDDDPGGDGEQSASGAPAEPGIDTRVEVGEVVGSLGKVPARDVAADVAEVVDRWLDAAYVAGDYPRSKFGDAFPGFTKDAATLAGRQRGLMSNQAVGAKVEGVTVTRRVVRVDVLAPKGKPAGATAHVNLVIELAGEVERTDQIRGRVVLTPAKRGWQVFGFDIERSAVKG
ncbi:hypothetical protein [Nocardioides bizhenqiangii]|uniref:SnoaL-like domain-containing protein n=1 Tax=Nocardioides bizhenqiangii TaxID=3095076 RepID=A0ABZ0ZMP9_9ACTN|nr:hypothetical protein [Nocardioides sp. HM61]WQQ25206.1 hypothetical protein SHK19_14680 [Nocardioides sp. HM61]